MDKSYTSGVTAMMDYLNHLSDTELAEIARNPQTELEKDVLLLYFASFPEKKQILS